MDDIIKIGISGNALGSGGYCNLINVGFDDVVVNRQVSFNGQTDTEYSIEVQQGANEAVFVLVANPLTVYSAGASRGGALCIFLSIPAGKYVRKKDTTPLTILHDILKKFREENMIQRGNVWEYQYKAFYDRTPFQKLSEDTKQYLAELPTYVPMAGNSELLVSIGDKLDAFFASDFQYPKFKECSRLVIADHIDGSNWEPEIPRSWSLEVQYNGNKVAELKNTNDKEHPITKILDPSDTVCYKPTEIKLWLDGYQVIAEGCSAKVDWPSKTVSITDIKWIENNQFARVSFKGFDANFSPKTIVCSVEGSSRRIGLSTQDNKDGFKFLGTEIKAVMGKKFHIEIDDDIYTPFPIFKKDADPSVDFPEEICIKAKPKLESKPEPEPKQEQELKSGTGQTKTSTPEPHKPNPTLQTVSNPSQFRLAQDSADKEKGNEETAGHNEDNIQQNPASPEPGTETNTLNNTADGVPEGKPEESILKFYRKKESWIGFALGFIFGIVLCFAAGMVYSKLPKLELKEELLNYEMPVKVTVPSLFIYNPADLDKAVDLYCNSFSLKDRDSLVENKIVSLQELITDQAKHFENLLYNLEDENYMLSFEDPKEISKWLDESKAIRLKSQIPAIDSVAKYCPMFVDSGSLIKSLLKKIPASTRNRDYNKIVTKEDYGALKQINGKLKGEHFKPIRMCIQGFYGSNYATDNDFTLKFKTILDTNEKVRNDTTFAQIKHHFD